MCDPHTIGLSSPPSVTSDVTSASHAATRDAAPSITVKDHISPVNADVSDASRDSAKTQAYAFTKSRSYQKRKEKLIVACNTLPDAELRSVYPAEHTSWRAMLRREKDGLCSVAVEFRDFRLFLHALGPCPKRGFTVDRIDNCNKTYGPGLVRWADKKTQNNNKSDTNIFVDPKSGKKYTTASLMKKHNCKSAVIRKRKQRHWTDAEQIAGKRLKASVASLKVEPATSLEPIWVRTMAEHFPKSLSVLSPAQRKMLSRFEDVCREATVCAAEVLAFVIADWQSFTEQAATENGLLLNDVSSLLPSIPQARFLAAYPASAINFWGQSVGCIWKNGRPIPLEAPNQSYPASPELADKL